MTFGYDFVGHSTSKPMNTITIDLGKEEAIRLVEYIDTFWRQQSGNIWGGGQNFTQPTEDQKIYLNKLKSMRDYLIKIIEK